MGVFDDGSARTGLLNLSRKWNGWGCGLVDLDNDGWLDLFVAGGGLDTQDAQSNRIFRNRAGPLRDVTDAVRQAFPEPALHRGVVFADFDRDGRIDAAVTALNAPIELWWNRTAARQSCRHWLQLRLHRNAEQSLGHRRRSPLHRRRTPPGPHRLGQCRPTLPRRCGPGSGLQYSGLRLRWPSEAGRACERQDCRPACESTAQWGVSGGHSGVDAAIAIEVGKDYAAVHRRLLEFAAHRIGYVFEAAGAVRRSWIALRVLLSRPPPATNRSSHPSLSTRPQPQPFHLRLIEQAGARAAVVQRPAALVEKYFIGFVFQAGHDDVGPAVAVDVAEVGMLRPSPL